LPRHSKSLLVLGATGHTGNHVVDLALARGHRVTAFVRSPQKLPQHASLRAVTGDPLDCAQLASALPGHDAVLSMLGPAPRDAFRPSSLLADAARSTVAAMETAGLRRLVIVSAALLFPERRLTFRFFRWFLQHHARDLTDMESIVAESNLDFTIARPPRLLSSPAEAYRSRAGGFPDGGAMSMSFRGVAAFLLDCVEQRELVGKVVGLTSR
jgi:putative NADH-flavin reductase